MPRPSASLRRVCSKLVLGVAIGAAAASCESTCGSGPAPTGSGSASTTTAGSTAPIVSAKAPAGPCPSCGAPAARGVVASELVEEASGLVASAKHRGVLYTHNDSGDTARFFAMKETGEDLGTYVLEGAPKAIDWEDMARGPCAGGAGSCLYFGDIGDNPEKRKSYVILRVAEPETLGPGDHAVVAEAFEFSYPDESHNAETLLVHPRTGVITIVTKVAFGESTVFESNGPLDGARKVELRAVGKLAATAGSPRFTGGDVHPDATGVLMRTYSNLFWFALKPDQTVAQALAAAPCTLPDADEEQGESVAWLGSGKGYVTLSEGTAQKLNETTCP